MDNSTIILDEVFNVDVKMISYPFYGRLAGIFIILYNLFFLFPHLHSIFVLDSPFFSGGAIWLDIIVIIIALMFDAIGILFFVLAYVKERWSNGYIFVINSNFFLGFVIFFACICLILPLVSFVWALVLLFWEFISEDEAIQELKDLQDDYIQYFNNLRTKNRISGEDYIEFEKKVEKLKRGSSGLSGSVKLTTEGEEKLMHAFEKLRKEVQDRAVEAE